MSLVGEKLLLRIYVENADRAPFSPTHERIVKAARNAHMAGATVLQGIAGEGYHAVHKRGKWFGAVHVPLIVEIVDGDERITAFIEQELDKIMVDGMLTLERAAVMLCRHGGGPSAHATQLTLAEQLKPLSTVPSIKPGVHMTVNEKGVLVRVFMGESDRFDGKPLHEAIVQKVRELGIAGATVLRGTEGFGANSVVHKASLLAMSSDLPIVIEIIDAEEKIRPLLPHLETMVQEGMVTMEYVVIVLYRHGTQRPG